uniref:CSON008055 protein n=1 Tax=Culicoides sonorensis TaxID=179676 RepID=A0A336MVP7_CULSO
MATKPEKWIFSFAVTETQRHKNFTTYKITSIIIPKNTPEALSCITVIKRFREVKQLYKDICRKSREVKINPVLIPEIKNTTYFKRFTPEVIGERKNYIIKLLNFIGDHPVLFRSEAFVKFFNTSQKLDSPEISESQSINEDNLSIDASSDTFPISEDLVNDDELCIQSNNLEAFLDAVEPKGEDDPLEQIVKTVFPVKSSNEDPETNILINKLTEEINLDRKLEDTRINDIERRLKLLVEENSFDYLYEAALRFTEAVEAEAIGLYQKAFDSYKSGIDLLLSGVKNDNDTERKKIVREKVTKYLAKAEDIYENFILQQSQDDSLVLLSTKNVEKSFEEITANIERPLNYLSRFKVIKIVDGLQQVQDVTDKKVYMLKVLQKPHSMQASRMIYLPQESRFMVPLVTYCQTNTSIFLLLKLISGGKLWDYIKSYQNRDNLQNKMVESGNFKTIFAEPPSKASPVHRLLSQLSLENETKNDDKIINIDGVDLQFPSIPGTPEAEISHQGKMDSVPSFEALSPQMEVNDLVNCSQKLLNSISSTLKRTKDAENSIDEGSLTSIDSDLESDVDEGSIGEILKEILEADMGSKAKDNENPDENEPGPMFLEPKPLFNDMPARVSPFTIPVIPKVRLLPSITVRQYCAELVCAIEDLHSHGIVCGDLSLDNILLGDKGQLQLTYFYRNETRLSAPNHKAVKYCYVAPERPLTRISDSWSLGVIMFELLTEQRFYELHPGGFEYYAELQFDNIDVAEDAQDLLGKLIEIDPNIRLTIGQVMQHSFFKLVDWTCVREKGKSATSN